MWGNPTLFHRAKYIENNIEKRQIFTQPIGKSFFQQAKSVERNIEKRQILTQSSEKSFLIDRLNSNNAIYRDSLTFIFSENDKLIRNDNCSKVCSENVNTIPVVISFLYHLTSKNGLTVLTLL